MNGERVKVHILPIPYEKTTSFGKGTENGPKAILEASSQVELFDEEFESEPYKCGIFTEEPVDLEGKGGQKAIELIEKRAEKIFSKNKFLLALGGEHSITAGLVRAAHKKYPDLHVVHFDAHADMRPEYEGSKWSHASVMHRIYEMGIPYTSIGIRALSKEEFELIEPHRKNYFFAYELAKNPNWIKEALETVKGPVFLSFDIDAFDSSVIPDTGTPEPGGLSWYQVMDFFKELMKEKKVVGADIVELLPGKPSRSSDFTAAKLAYKIIGYWNQFELGTN